LLVELSWARAGSSRSRVRDNSLRQLLAQFDTPLVEGIDVPDGALSEDAMLIERPNGPSRSNTGLTDLQRDERAAVHSIT
jgi:hypothetical protein